MIIWGKKVGVLLVILVFFSLSTSAQEVGIREAIDLSWDNSIDLQIATIDLENSRINYKKTEADIMRTGSRYAQLQNELGLMQAENSFLQSENRLVRDTVSQYFSLILTEMELERKETSLELEKRRLEEVEKQVQTGHRSQLDLIQQQSSYNSAAFELEAVRQDLIQDREEFRYKLGLEELPYITKDILLEVESVEIAQENFLEIALASATEITVREKQLELAEIDLNRAREASTPALDLEQKENNLEIARLNITKTEQDVKHRFQQMYNGFTRAQNSLQLAGERLEEAEKNHEIIVRQEELGLRTINDLLASRISLMGAKQSFSQAVNSYYLVLFDIYEAMGHNLKEVADEILQK